MNVSFICMSSLVLIMVATCQWSVIKRTFISFRSLYGEFTGHGLTLSPSYVAVNTRLIPVGRGARPLQFTD